MSADSASDDSRRGGAAVPAHPSIHPRPPPLPPPHFWGAASSVEGPHIGGAQQGFIVCVHASVADNLKAPVLPPEDEEAGSTHTNTHTPPSVLCKYRA